MYRLGLGMFAASNILAIGWVEEPRRNMDRRNISIQQERKMIMTDEELLERVNKDRDRRKAAAGCISFVIMLIVLAVMASVVALVFRFIM